MFHACFMFEYFLHLSASILFGNYVGEEIKVGKLAALANRKSNPTEIMPDNIIRPDLDKILADK